MHLLIDGCPLQTPARDRGIGRYSSGLLRAIRKIRPNWRIEIIEHSRLPAIPQELLSGLPIIRFEAPFPYDLKAPAQFHVNDLYFADWLLARRPDHVLFASVFERLGVIPRFLDRRLPTSAIMYDLIPLLYPEQYRAWCGPLSKDDRWYGKRFRDTRRMGTLFAISQASANDAQKLLGPDGPVIHNILGAVDPKFVPHSPSRLATAEGELRRKYQILSPFILYVGGEDYRKNLFGAVAGFATLPPPIRDRYQLVIACYLPDPVKRELQAQSERWGIGGRVSTTGFVSDDDLITLYQCCRLFFFPSIYEGLGLPVLEALTCGAPVACSNCSSLPEFAGEVAYLFDPHSPRSMADALARCLAEPRERRFHDRTEYARSFTWDKTAEVVARGIESGSRPAPPAVKRLAWISDSLIAGRMHPDPFVVLSQLPPPWKVECLIPDRRDYEDLAARHLLLATSEFEPRNEAEPYHLVAAHIGPGGPSQFVREIITRHNGLVVLNHPNLSAYAEPEMRTVLAHATVVLVCSSIMRKWVRTMTDSPVVLLPPQITLGEESHRVTWWDTVLSHAANLMEQDERKWVNAASNALAEIRDPVPSDLFDRWSELRFESAVVRPLTQSSLAVA